MTAWAGRHVLVTGASGLLGSAVCASLLERGAEVVALVLDRDERSALFRDGTARWCAVVEGRLQDGEAVARALAVHRVDTVVHLGAQTQVRAAWDHPLETWETNVRGTYQVLEACRVQHRLVDRVLVASSDKVYGDAPVPYHEDGPLAAVFPYDVSKLVTEHLVRCYVENYGLRAVVSRCGNIFGPGDLNWDRLVPGTLRSLLAGTRPVVRSNGKLVRDYLYVGDAAEGMLRLLEESHRPEVRACPVNLAAGNPMTVLEMVDAVSRAAGIQLEPEVRHEAHHEIEVQHLATDRAASLLAWRARVPLGDALSRTAAWYRALLRRA
jgi:CDP-glucose 4,6-dehydratase